MYIPLYHMNYLLLWSAEKNILPRVVTGRGQILKNSGSFEKPKFFATYRIQIWFHPAEEC